ncbi:MAG: T9SS type A sorting domain-containing protein [Bacteroidota bacterium]
MLRIYQFLFVALLLAGPASLFGQLSNVTDVTLTFTPVGGGTAITATATDSDGDGPNAFQVNGTIDLMESTEYRLSIDVQNTIDNADLTTAIQQNANDYLFFFSYTDSLTTSPAGDGNIDNRMDPMDYQDQDGNSLPVGLLTNWETECTEEPSISGSFRVQLQYQPGMKTASSTSSMGTTEFNITWDFDVNEDPDAPPCENEEEIITDVTLTFTPMGGGAAVVATAKDPDGPGPQSLEIENDIDLIESTVYELSIELFNSIEQEDITEEIMEEDDEHQFFFAFTDSVITSPAGDGNIDNRDDPIDYKDFDRNNLPLGLLTDWESECIEDGNISGTFRVVLKHQPGIKTNMTDVNDGGTDIDLTWNINVIEDDDAPPCENEEEIITDVTLTFTPVGGGDAVVATAKDPDGPGPQPLEVENAIDLVESTEYELAITLFNSIEQEDITEEIMEEDDEHMFFFAFTDSVMTSPAGNGNIDNRMDPIDYNDLDGNDLPVGLSTQWESECIETGSVSGTFQVILKHQPGEKSSTSTVDVGGTDVDLTWTLNVNEDTDAPPCENEEEVITDVTLTFTPVGGGAPVTATAADPDGPGPQSLEVTKQIRLAQNTEYEMSIELFNSIEQEDITEEIMEEDDEHQFFFEWTDGLFDSPTGNGNADNRDDPVNYNDFDGNDLPVGLSTNWTTKAAMTDGTFRVVLKHQPGIKTDMTDINDGGTDIDITWDFSTLVTSAEDLESPNAALKLAPNPVKANLSWLLEGDQLADKEVFIYDQFGRVIYNQRLQSIGWNSVDVSALPNGVYHLQVRSDDQSWVQRFLKID